MIQRHYGPSPSRNRSPNGLRFLKVGRARLGRPRRSVSLNVVFWIFACMQRTLIPVPRKVTFLQNYIFYLPFERLSVRNPFAELSNPVEFWKCSKWIAGNGNIEAGQIRAPSWRAREHQILFWEKSCLQKDAADFLGRIKFSKELRMQSEKPIIQKPFCPPIQSTSTVRKKSDGVWGQWGWESWQPQISPAEHGNLIF